MTITDEGDRAVGRKKRREERYSYVMDRVASETGTLRDCYGAWEMDDNEAREMLSTLDRYWHAATIELRKGVKRRS